MNSEVEIFNRVKELMQEITIANGYSFDVKKVYDSRDENAALNESELPMINIVFPENLTWEEDEQKRRLRIFITLEDVGNDSPSVIRSRKQDILNAFKQIEPDVTAAQFLGTYSDTETISKKSTVCEFSFEVDYQTERWQI